MELRLVRNFRPCSKILFASLGTFVMSEVASPIILSGLWCQTTRKGRGITNTVAGTGYAGWELSDGPMRISLAIPITVDLHAKQTR